MKAAEILWQLIFGLCAGCTVAAGLFTFIVTLGIVTRLSQVTKSAAFIHWYENSFIVGGIVGNLLWIYREWFSLLPESKISAALILGAFGLFGGIFTGCLIGSIAEILNAFPILFRRLNLKTGTALVVAALAAGKLLGIFLQFFG